MIKLILVFYMTIISTVVVAQNTYSLKGAVKDKEGNSIIGATVVISNQPTKGAITDINGEYLINIGNGTHTVLVLFIGYEDYKREIKVSKDTLLDVILNRSILKLDEVVVNVRSRDERVANTQIGVEKIILSEMSRTPALFGENDIIKSVTYLPGVKSQGDGQSGFQVRGGTASQNLILYDDNPVYNSGHVLGIFSVFNDDALSDATLYKGLVPAQFGGASSSVFDIKAKTGDMQNYKFGVDIGLLLAKGYAEGPIVGDKASFFISARRTYFDLFLKATDDFSENTINFYDINAKLYYKPGENDAISLSLFNGKDNMGLESLFDMDWGNLNGTLNWYHRYNNKLTSNTKVIYSNYTSTYEMDIAGIENLLSGFIKSYGVKHEFILAEYKHQLIFGLQSAYIDLKSAEWTMSGFNSAEQRQGWDNSIWVNDEWKINSKLSLLAGVRLNSFSALGGAPYYTFDSNGEINGTLDYDKGDFVNTYFSIEPRISANYRLTDNHSIKFGYAKSSQNVYNIQNNTSMMPFTRYTMASNYLKPQVSNQISLGYMAATRNRYYEFALETYYKSTQNVYDYKDGKLFSSDIAIEALLLGGKGRSYGVELLIKKSLGKFTGWIGYTLSWTETKIDGINNGKWYTASNDMRHNISVVAMYEISKTWRASATWIYNTGQALTAPSAKYDINGQIYYYYAERNGYRAPAYHRLDISFTHVRKFKNYAIEWSFGLYNVYNRHNPYLISFEDDPTNDAGTKTMQYSLFGILPSVTFGIQF